MKKSILKTALLILSCIPLFLFSSCEFFNTGDLLKKKIDEEIQYMKEQEVKINVSPESSKEGKTYPGETVTYRVTDKFTARFVPEEGYMFVKWAVKDYVTGLSIEDVLKIEKPEELETTVEIIGAAENIHLYPLVYERPSVESFAPKNEETGVAKDSSIIIEFSKKLSAENDFSKIQITSAGDSIADSYLKPVVNENILTIAANKSNLLDVTAGKSKTVTVKIPSDFYYEENGNQIVLGKEISYSFKINETTNNKAEITVSAPKEVGTLTPSGTANYNIGDTVNIFFEPKEYYSFVGWNVLDANGDKVPDSVIHFADKTSPDTSFTIYTDVKGISITPESSFMVGVKTFSPELATSGVRCDTDIVINFRSVMDINSFRFEDDEITAGAEKLFDSNDLCYGYILNNEIFYKNIYIENSVTGENVTYSYNVPVLSSDGKSLVLKPKYNHLLLDKKSTSLITLNVMINTDNSVRDFNGNKMQNLYSKQFRINSSRDTLAPSEISFIIAKNKIDIEKIKIGERTPFSTKSYDDWEREDFINNLVSKPRIYVKGYSASSQLYKVKVYETLIRDANSEGLIENPVTTEGYCNGIFSSVAGQNGFWEGIFEYEFNCEKDGVVNLKFEIEDYFGNSDIIAEYLVNKDTKISNVAQFAVTDHQLLSSGYGVFERTIYNDLLDYNYVSTLKDVIPIYWVTDLEDRYRVGKGNSISNEDTYTTEELEFEYEVLWAESLEEIENGNYYSSGRLTTEDVLNRYYGGNISGRYDYTYVTNCYLIKEFDRSKDYVVKVIAYDYADNEFAGYTVLSKVPNVITEDYDSATNNLTIQVDAPKQLLNDMSVNYILYICDEFGNESEFEFNQTSLKTKINITDNLKYKVQAIVSTSGDYDQYLAYNYKYSLHGQMSDLYSFNCEKLLDESIELNIPKCSYISKGKSTGKYTLTFEVSENNFDKLYIKSKVKVDADEVINCFEPCESRLSFDVDTDLLYGKYYYYTLVGVIGESKNLLDSYVNLNVENNCQPVLDPNYIAMGEHGDNLILNAPVSATNIREENIKCYYSVAPSLDSDSLSRCYYNVGLAIELTKKGLLTSEEIKSYKTLPVKYYSSTDKTKIKIPVKELPDFEKYLFCLDVTDDLGNNICSSFIYYDTIHAISSYEEEINSATSNNIFKYSSEKGDRGNVGNFCIQVEKLKNNKWEKITEREAMKASTRISQYNVNVSKYDTAINASKDGGTFKGFYRVYVYGNAAAFYSNPGLDEYNAITNNGTPSVHTVFAYPQYMYYANNSVFQNSTSAVLTGYIKEGLSGAFPYFTKHPTVSDLTGEDEIVVYSNKLFLVETLYSKYDWSEECEKTDRWKDLSSVKDRDYLKALYWEKHVPDEQYSHIELMSPADCECGTDTGCGMRLYKVDKSKIPAGYYYVTIIRYANGTCSVSSVHKK